MAQPSGNAPFAPWDNPGQSPLIRFAGITKRFGEFVAIDNLSLDIFEHEFYVLLGPSGCGKTTLLRMLAGFETPSEGAILLDGRNIVPVPPNKRAVNMMFQSYALFPHLTVADNIAFGLKRSAMPKSEIPARVDEMLRLTRLEKFARRKPHQISGGQRQRVALARSLAKAPRLLLLDEPMAALDKKLRKETQLELMDIQEKTGTTFVIVTHDQEEAMTVGSRVAVMGQGRLIQVATPEQIYEAPNSVYVADFIGDVNIVEGAANPLPDGTCAISWAEGQPPIVCRAGEAIAPGTRVSFAIRPEKILISAEKPSDQANVLAGKVLDIAYLGNISTYHVKLPSGQVIKAQAANTRRVSKRNFNWEDAVWLSFGDSAGLLLTR